MLTPEVSAGAPDVDGRCYHETNQWCDDAYSGRIHLQYHFRLVLLLFVSVRKFYFRPTIASRSFDRESIEEMTTAALKEVEDISVAENGPCGDLHISEATRRRDGSPRFRAQVVAARGAGNDLAAEDGPADEVYFVLTHGGVPRLSMTTSTTKKTTDASTTTTTTMMTLVILVVVGADREVVLGRAAAVDLDVVLYRGVVLGQTAVVDRAAVAVRD